MNLKNIKRKNENYLISQEIPIVENLPIYDVGKVRNEKQTARRAVLCYAIAGLANDASPMKLKKWLEEERLWNNLLDLEKTYFSKTIYSKQEIIDFSWHKECLYTLCWIGGIIEELDMPFEECSLDSIFSKIPPEITVDNFIDNFHYISNNTIIETADLYYRIHSTTHHPELWKESKKAYMLNMSVIRERRRTFEWVLDDKTIWTDISLDT